MLLHSKHMLCLVLERSQVVYRTTQYCMMKRHIFRNNRQGPYSQKRLKVKTAARKYFSQPRRGTYQSWLTDGKEKHALTKEKYIVNATPEVEGKMRGERYNGTCT